LTIRIGKDTNTVIKIVSMITINATAVGQIRTIGIAGARTTRNNDTSIVINLITGITGQAASSISIVSIT